MATFQTNADYYKAAPNFEPTQPNPTEKVGRATKKADCVVRAFSIVTGYSWLESFDILAEHARRTYNMVNDPLNYCEVFRERGYTEYTEKAVKGQKRLTVEQFAQQHPTGRYMVKVAHHLTAVIDGVIKDAWNTSNEVVYKYFEVC